MKKVAAELGKDNITFREYRGKGKYSSSTISDRFGSWNKALEIIGLRASEYKNISDKEFLNDLKKVADELKKEKITSREYNARGKYTSSTINDRFGSWNKAIENAGLTIKEHKNISIEALFENIEQVWLKLGKQPTFRDMKLPLSNYTASAYERNFGTWRKALEKFVEFINSEEVETEQSIKVKPEIETEQTIDAKSETTHRHKTKRNINWRLRFLVMRRDNFKCNACGKSPTNNPGTELHIDHIISWDKGGETILENLQTLVRFAILVKVTLTIIYNFE